MIDIGAEFERNRIQRYGLPIAVAGGGAISSGEAAEEIIERAILLDDDYHVLNVLLQQLSKCGRWGEGDVGDIGTAAEDQREDR